MHRRTLWTLATALAVSSALQPALAQSQKKLAPAELDQILAPIALYPDPLLAQTLMASTYPLDVVQAARWSKANPNLKGDAAIAAVKDQNWDTSVKSLVAFPQVLMQLSDHLDWTQKLGDAMISQQEDVADSVQRLRAKAADAGNLKSGPQQTVTSDGAGTDRVYAIKPTDPDLVYAPAYDPSWAYGGWSDSAHPPVYYPPQPAAGYGSLLSSGLMWGLGIAAASALFSSWNWGRNNSYVNVNADRAAKIDNKFDRGRYDNDKPWRHNPDRGRGGRDAAKGEPFDKDKGPDKDQKSDKGQRSDKQQDRGQRGGGGDQRHDSRGQSKK
jgi:hypothetical protein